MGRRNAGKTTLVCELVDLLTQRGHRVATIKHTHHNHELDAPGKDSWKHREAGAVGVGILSPHMMAAFVPSDRAEQDESGYAKLAQVFAGCDLLLVEGDLHTDGDRIEVWRSAVTEPPYAQQDNHILAVISDDPIEVSQPVWPRSNVGALADRVVELMRTAGSNS